MPSHASLTGADLHEPKGVAAASNHTIYVANGAGSGSWVKIDTDNIDTTSIFNVNGGVFDGVIADVSTASAILFVFPWNANINRITTVLGGTITGADSTVTVTKTGGASMGTITVAQSGSAEGDVDQLTPVSNNTVTTNQWVKIATDGGSTNTIPLYITLEYTRAA